MAENLPANPLSDFVSGYKKHRRASSGPLEGGFLNFNSNSGLWTMGQEGVEVNNCEVIIASQTMQHGYMRWGDDTPVKVWAPVNEDWPEKPEPFDGTDDEGRPKTYTAQEARRVQGKFRGEDEDLGQFIFNSSSMAGVENTVKLFDAIMDQAEENPVYVFPVVRLDREHYIHKTRKNKIFKPVWEIVGWADIEGNLETAGGIEHDDAPEDDEGPKRSRRRRKVA